MKLCNPSKITPCRIPLRNVWYTLCLVYLFYSGAEAVADAPIRAESTQTTVGKVSDYVEFACTKPLNQVYVCEPWREGESSEIDGALREVLSFDPGLLQLAASGGKIRVFRVASIPLKRGGAEARTAIAISDKTELYISDLFFMEASRLHVLIHELVHLADAGGHIAYSDRWAKFALPVINDVRKMLASGIAPEQIEVWLRAYRILPGLGSCANLKEALADDYAALVLGEAYPMQISTACRLIRPTSKDKSFECHFQRGSVALTKGQFQDAALEFTKARDIDTTAPLCHFYLARSYFALSDFKSSADECRSAIKQFDDLGVCDDETDRRNTMHLYAMNMMNLGHYKEATELLNNVLSSETEPSLIDKAKRELDYCVQKLSQN